MKRLLLILLVSCRVIGQNIVTNPSFENYSSCPNVPGDINYATSWMSYGNSPDYYNSCSTYSACLQGPSFSVPFSSAGYQLAATGQGYCGLLTYYNMIQDSREFIGSQL